MLFKTSNNIVDAPRISVFFFRIVAALPGKITLMNQQSLTTRVQKKIDKYPVGRSVFRRVDIIFHPSHFILQSPRDPDVSSFLFPFLLAG